MIFVDTSFWAALRNPRDDRHQAASALFAGIEDGRLVTTNQVRGETWTLMRARAGHAEAVRFLDRLEESTRLVLEWVDGALEAEALTWLRRHDERAYSFVDATSFAVMRSLGIRDALTFDADFAAAGFTVLEAQTRSGREVAVFVDRGDRYLLMRRVDRRIWHVPAGVVESGETTPRYPASITEVAIETFAAAAPADWEPLLNDEHDAHRWCSLKEALPLLHWEDARGALRLLARRLTMSA